jgi:hypothetical protein
MSPEHDKNDKQAPRPENSRRGNEVSDKEPEYTEMVASRQQKDEGEQELRRRFEFDRQDSGNTLLQTHDQRFGSLFAEVQADCDSPACEPDAPHSASEVSPFVLVSLFAGYASKRFNESELGQRWAEYRAEKQAEQDFSQIKIVSAQEQQERLQAGRSHTAEQAHSAENEQQGNRQVEPWVEAKAERKADCPKEAQSSEVAKEETQIEHSRGKDCECELE